jgi:hypothetical protein
MWCRSLIVGVALLCGVTAGCARTARDLKLDPQLAEASLDQALRAWAEGKQPADLRPTIIMRDQSWDAGTALAGFTIQTAEARSDGTNLYLPVVREFRDAQGKVSRSTLTYIVGTSPTITIFPQE